LVTIPQRGTTLDQRLAAAFEDASVAGLPTVLVGMDTPQMSSGLLTSISRRLLEGEPAVLGHTADGGWWVLGLGRPDPSLLLGVPTSTARTGALQLARLEEAGLSVGVAPALVDVDTAPDAWAVAEVAPMTHFARLLRTLEDVR
jgi:glycosyltransferase A (GT-A) superfamily protein (DUF2064 family)